MRHAGGMLVEIAGMLDSATKFAAAATLLLATSAQIGAILSRNLEGSISLILQEMAAAGFFLLVFLSIPVTIAANRHVRLEIFAATRSEYAGRQRERLTFLLFAVPLFAIILYGLAGMALDSWRIGERFSDVSGLTGFWLVRFVAAIAIALSILQAATRLLVLQAPER